MKNTESTVFLVDDDHAVRDALVLLMETEHLNTESFDSAETFLDACDPDRPGCLVLDVRMPGMSGIKMQEELAARGVVIPIIFLTGHADVSMSVQAFRSGAIDFMEKPFDENILLERIQEAIRLDQSNRKALDKQTNAESRLASLTRREDEIMWLIVAGKANKQIAAELDLSHRTVESHRGRIMEKTGARSLPDLVKLARVSRGSGQD